MSEHYQTFIQERIDELHVLGKQAQRHIEQLSQQQHLFMTGSQQLFTEMTTQARKVEQSLIELHDLAVTIKQDLKNSQKRIWRSFQVIGVTIAVLIISTLAATGIVQYYSNKIMDKRNELSLIDTTFQQAPYVIRYEGKDYIRINPETTGYFTSSEGENMGAFAVVEYKK